MVITVQRRDSAISEPNTRECALMVTRIAMYRFETITKVDSSQCYHNIEYADRLLLFPRYANLNSTC